MGSSLHDGVRSGQPPSFLGRRPEAGVRGFGEHWPTLESPYEVHPDAAIVGRVFAGPGLSLRAYAVLRADGEDVRVGARAFFGERSTVHIADAALGAHVGDDVVVGRFAIVHACSLEDGVVVGDAAVVLDGAHVGARSWIAPGALVPPRKRLEGGFVYAGSPAVAVRRIDAEELARIADSMRASPAAPSEDMPPLDASAYLPPGATRGVVHATRHGEPRLAGAYVAPNATVIGDVWAGADSGIYFSCVVSAGDGRIVIGERTNIQDNSLLVTDVRRGALEIGPGVTVGHNVRIGSGRIEEDALIGIGSCLGDDVVIERGACVGARAVVLPGTVVRAGWIWAGRPAQAFRELKAAERAEFDRGRDVYIRYGAVYLGANA